MGGLSVGDVRYWGDAVLMVGRHVAGVREYAFGISRFMLLVFLCLLRFARRVMCL